MSADIGPGDFVEALVSSLAAYGCRELIAGQIYRVSAVLEGDPSLLCCKGRTFGVSLDGDAPDATMVWCTGCAVRPIYRPSADLIESLTAPAPAERAPVLTPA